MRRDVFIPEVLSAEEKVALFVETINAQEMNAVVVSPEFFEEVKRNPKITVEYGNEAEGMNMANEMIGNALDLLYKYEGITAEVKRNPKVTVELENEQENNMADKMIENALDLLYKYEGVVAYTKEPATVEGVRLFVKPIGSEFEIHN